MNILLSTIITILCLGFCIYVYEEDKIEKEPISMLLILLVLGMAAYAIKHFASNWIIELFDKLIRDPNIAKTGVEEVFNKYHWTSQSAEYLHTFLCSFVGVALVSVLFKWLALYLVTFKNKNFNYYFDGVVYSVFVSMGFAIAENIAFAIQNSWDVFLKHFVILLPVHIMSGIIMGLIYSKYHVRHIANVAENKMIKNGVLEKDTIKEPVFTLILSLLVPLMLEFLFDFFYGSQSIQTTGKGIIFYVVAAALLAICFVLITKASKSDREDVEMAEDIIGKTHAEYDKTKAPVSQYDNREENGEASEDE